MACMDSEARRPLPLEIWGTLSASVQEYIQALQVQVQQLEGQVKELKARLGQNSQNSSRPPSSDSPRQKGPKKDKTPSGRKGGGQPGHPGRHRALYSLGQVDEVVTLYPQQCDHCGESLAGAPPRGKIWRHQVVELPEVKVKVSEYQLHRKRCRSCGQKSRAKLPPGVPRRSFGLRLQSVVTLLTGRYRLSRREACQLLKDLWQAEISLGGLSCLEGVTTDALAPVMAEVAQEIQGAESVNLDETGWTEGNSRAWLWTAVTPKVSLFRIEASRSGAVVEKLLGKDFCGVAGTDRYGAYNRIPLKQRALCHAHLKRNFQGLVDRRGEGARVGNWGVRELGRLFALWHRFQDGELDRKGMQEELKPIKARFGRVLEQGLWGEDPKAETLCWQLKQQWEALWTFAQVEGVEPTNNAAERALRPGVLWRKGSFGSQSQRGSRFAEVMMSVAASCRQQKRNLLGFLMAACRATLSDSPIPSLVPQSPTQG